MLTFAYDESVLVKLAKALAEKYPGKLHRKSLHCNTSVHSSHQTKTILWEQQWEITGHPSCNPAFSSSDFFSFSNLQKYLKAAYFPIVNNVKKMAIVKFPETKAPWIWWSMLWNKVYNFCFYLLISLSMDIFSLILLIRRQSPHVCFQQTWSSLAQVVCWLPLG